MQLQNLTCIDIFTIFKHVSASEMEFIQVQDWEFIADWNNTALVYWNSIYSPSNQCKHGGCPGDES